jgi:putative FmdB family regulatory protein
MPIYEYHCDDCGKEFEKLVRFSDPVVNSPDCPNCQSTNTHKRISSVAVIGGSQTQSSSSCSSSGPFT